MSCATSLKLAFYLLIKYNFIRGIMSGNNELQNCISHIVKKKRTNRVWLKHRIQDIVDKEKAHTVSNEVVSKINRVATINERRLKAVRELVGQKQEKLVIDAFDAVAEKTKSTCIEFNDRSEMESGHPGLCIAFHRYCYRKGFVFELLFDFNFWFFKVPFRVINFFLTKCQYILDILGALNEFSFHHHLIALKASTKQIADWYTVNIMDNLDVFQRYVDTSLSILEAQCAWAPMVACDTPGYRPALGGNDMIDQGIVGICPDKLISCQKLHRNVVKMKYHEFTVFACDFQQISSTKKAFLTIKKILKNYEGKRVVIGISTNRRFQNIEKHLGMSLVCRYSNLLVLASSNCDVTHHYKDTGVVGLFLDPLVKSGDVVKEETVSPKQTPESPTEKVKQQVVLQEFSLSEENTKDK
jgi:hypothetical protein